MKTNDSNDRDIVFKNYSSDSRSDIDLIAINRPIPRDANAYFSRKSCDNCLETNSLRRSRSRTKKSLEKNNGQLKEQIVHSKKDSVPSTYGKGPPISAHEGRSYKFSNTNIDYKKLYVEAMDPTFSNRQRTPKSNMPYMVSKQIPVYPTYMETNGSFNNSSSLWAPQTKSIPLCLCNPKNRANCKGKPPGRGIQCPFFAFGNRENRHTEKIDMQSMRHSPLRASLGRIDPRFSMAHPLVTESITQTDPIPMEDKQIDAYISDDEEVMYMQQMEGEEIKKWKCRPVKEDAMFPGGCCGNGCGNDFNAPYWCGPDLDLFEDVEWRPCCCVGGCENTGVEETDFTKYFSVKSLAAYPESGTPKNKKNGKEKKKEKSKSPRKESKSPKKESKSPKKESKSPKKGSKSPKKESKSIATSYSRIQAETPKKKERKSRKSRERRVYRGGSQPFLQDVFKKSVKQSDSGVSKYRKTKDRSNLSSRSPVRSSSSAASRSVQRRRVQPVAYQTDPDQQPERVFSKAVERHEHVQDPPPALAAPGGKIKLKGTGKEKKNSNDIYSSFECRNREGIHDSGLIIKDILKKSAGHSRKPKIGSVFKEKSKKYKRKGKLLVGSDTTDQGDSRNHPTTKLRIISFSADSTDAPASKLKNGGDLQVSSSGGTDFLNKREFGIKKVKLNKSCKSAYVLVKRRN